MQQFYRKISRAGGTDRCPNSPWNGMTAVHRTYLANLTRHLPCNGDRGSRGTVDHRRYYEAELLGAGRNPWPLFQRTLDHEPFRLLANGTAERQEIRAILSHLEQGDLHCRFALGASRQFVDCKRIKQKIQIGCLSYGSASTRPPNYLTCNPLEGCVRPPLVRAKKPASVTGGSRSAAQSDNV